MYYLATFGQGKRHAVKYVHLISNSAKNTYESFSVLKTFAESHQYWMVEKNNNEPLAEKKNWTILCKKQFYNFKYRIKMKSVLTNYFIDSQQH